MFDYDKTRSYRIFIACADKQVYAYNQEGNLVKGWRFGGTEHLVTLPVNHFRIGSKDYIVFSDRMRIYILDRRGNERVKVAEQFPLSPNNNIMLDEHTSGPSRMVTTDNTGHVVFISFDGRTEKRVLGEFSNSHFFHYRDLDGNGTKEFIYTDSNRLTAFNTNGSRRFNFEFNSEVRLKPNIYQFARNDLKLGVAIPEENQIFLLNNDGKLYSGFPLQGNTSFSIGKLKNSNTRFSLIVGNEDNFLFNYSVQ
jgi:outer membrane protein assembly factor BamB